MAKAGSTGRGRSPSKTFADSSAPTPVKVLTEARSIAQKAGLHYVCIGNVRGVPDAETTFCPNCKRPVIERDVYFVRSENLDDGRCRFCGAEIAGFWQGDSALEPTATRRTRSMKEAVFLG